MEKYDLSQDTIRFDSDIELYAKYFKLYVEIWKECKNNIKERYAVDNINEVCEVVNNYVSLAVKKSIELLIASGVKKINELEFMDKYKNHIDYKLKIGEIEKTDLNILIIKSKESILACLDSAIQELYEEGKLIKRKQDLNIDEEMLKRNALYYEELLITGNKLSLDRYYNMKNNEMEEVKGTTICLIITNLIMIMILIPLYVFCGGIVTKVIVVSFLFVSIISCICLSIYFLLGKLDERKVLKKMQKDYYRYYGIEN